MFERYVDRKCLGVSFHRILDGDAKDWLDSGVFQQNVIVVGDKGEELEGEVVGHRPV
jgi:hypothetical protein